MTQDPDRAHDGEVVLDAELVDVPGPECYAAALPVSAHRPRYLVDRHTVLGPGELPPTAGDEPAYTEAGFRITVPTADLRTSATPSPSWRPVGPRHRMIVAGRPPLACRQRVQQIR